MNETWEEVDPSGICELEEFALTKIRFFVNQKVSRHLIDSVTIDEYSKIVGGDLVYRLEGHVYGEQREQVVVYPSSWWQAFKERWFPRFLASKFPVKYTKVDVHFDVVFPDYDPPEQLGQLVVNSYVKENRYE